MKIRILLLCLTATLLSGCTFRQLLDTAGGIEQIAHGTSYIRTGLAVADAARGKQVTYEK